MESEWIIRGNKITQICSKEFMFRLEKVNYRGSVLLSSEKDVDCERVGVKRPDNRSRGNYLPYYRRPIIDTMILSY
jgi:hypothetical protein